MINLVRNNPWLVDELSSSLGEPCEAPTCRAGILGLVVDQGNEAVERPVRYHAQRAGGVGNRTGSGHKPQDVVDLQKPSRSDLGRSLLAALPLLIPPANGNRGFLLVQVPDSKIGPKLRGVRDQREVINESHGHDFDGIPGRIGHQKGVVVGIDGNVSGIGAHEN